MNSFHVFREYVFAVYFNVIWRNSYNCRLCFMKTEAFPVKFLGTGEVNVVEAESLLEPYLQQFPNVCLEFHVSVFSRKHSTRLEY